jgi:hypothetical protein
MNRFNSISTTINDLIKHQESRVEYLKRCKSASKAVGRNAFFIDHTIECAEQILTLLKKYKRDPQCDLFKEIQNTRK